MTNEDRGVLYIAFGENYIKEAIISAESVKLHSPNMHITIMADVEIPSPFVDSYIKIIPEHIRAKVDYINKTPYSETIFLDSDTVVDHDISELFGVLERFDLGITHDYARKRENISMMIPEYEKIPYSFSEVNPGVMVFNNNQLVQEFFADWKSLFYKYQDTWPYEQPTFRAALWDAKMRYYILPPEFNARSKQCRKKAVRNHDLYGEDHLKIRIYHLHVNEKIGKGIFKYDTLKKCLKKCKKLVYPI